MRIDIEPYDDRHVFSVTWIVRGDGEPVAADDVEELRWFARDELPPRWRSPARSSCYARWAARHRTRSARGSTRNSIGVSSIVRLAVDRGVEPAAPARRS